MTTDTLQLTPGPDSDLDVPREISGGHTRADLAFNGMARALGIFVLVLTGAIGLFLGLQMIPVLRHYGFSFFTQAKWVPDENTVGVLAAIWGTIEIAVIAMVIAFPLALGTALFITELAPRQLRSFLVSMVDLMAAVPSIIYGLWGYLLLQPHAIHLSRWFAEYLGWFPLFHVDTNAHSATWQESIFLSSPFIAGLTVSMMATPLACAIMRGVFSQAPLGEREAALALGSTKWGVIRTVVLPFGRGGIIGGTMLGLGRALGETVAVLLILNESFRIDGHFLQSGYISISSLIANFFNSATSLQLKALLAAGFVLFVMTLVVNTLAGIIVNRSRSGAATEI